MSNAIHVVGIFPFLSKFFLTWIALVKSHSRMPSNVSIKIRLGMKTFATKFTLVFLFLVVNKFHMVFQKSLGFGFFSADLTLDIISRIMNFR